MYMSLGIGKVTIYTFLVIMGIYSTKAKNVTDEIVLTVLIFASCVTVTDLNWNY